MESQLHARQIPAPQQEHFIAASPGGFSSEPFVAGSFAIQLLVFLASTGLLVWTFRQERPALPSQSSGQQFFKLRVALCLFVVSKFFAWVFMAGATGNIDNAKYVIFSFFPLGFGYAAEGFLLYTLVRLAWQPLVHARSYRHARAVGIGLASVFSLVAFVTWVSWVALIAAELHDMAVTPNEQNWSASYENAEAASTISYLAYWAAGTIWGLVVMGAAIDALRKSRSKIDPSYHIVPKLMIPASILWFGRFAVDFLWRPYTQYGVRFVFNGVTQEYRGVMPFIQAFVSNVLLLVIFVLCFLCFRPHLLAFYSDGFSEFGSAAIGGSPGPAYNLDSYRPEAELQGTQRPANIGSHDPNRSAAVAPKASQGNESDNERIPVSFV